MRLPTYQEYVNDPKIQEFVNTIGGQGTGGTGIKLSENYFNTNIANEFSIWEKSQGRLTESLARSTDPGASQEVRLAPLGGGTDIQAGQQQFNKQIKETELFQKTGLVNDQTQKQEFTLPNILRTGSKGDEVKA